MARGDDDRSCVFLRRVRRTTRVRSDLLGARRSVRGPGTRRKVITGFAKQDPAPCRLIAHGELRDVRSMLADADGLGFGSVKGRKRCLFYRENRWPCFDVNNNIINRKTEEFFSRQNVFLYSKKLNRRSRRTVRVVIFS